MIVHACKETLSLASWMFIFACVNETLKSRSDWNGIYKYARDLSKY